MGEANGRWRATYTPGNWVVLSGPTLLLVMPPAPPKHSRLLNDLWTDVVRAVSILDLTQTLAAYRLDALPHFGVLFWANGGMRSLLRGRVLVRDAETGEELATGEGVQTWAEIGLGDVRRVHIDLEAVSGSVLQLPLVTGAVTASAVQVDATDEARLVFPVTEDELAPVHRDEQFDDGAGAPDPGQKATGAAGVAGVAVVPAVLPAGRIVPDPVPVPEDGGTKGPAAESEAVGAQEPVVGDAVAEEAEPEQQEPEHQSEPESPLVAAEPEAESELAAPESERTPEPEPGQGSGSGTQPHGQPEPGVTPTIAPWFAALRGQSAPVRAAEPEEREVADLPGQRSQLTEQPEQSDAPVAPGQAEPEEPERPVEVADLDLPDTVLAEPMGTDFDADYAEREVGPADLTIAGSPAAAGPVTGLGLDDDGGTLMGPPGSVFRVPPGPVPTPPMPVGGAGLVPAPGLGGPSGPPVRLPGPASPFPGSGQVPYPQPRPAPQGVPPATGEPPAGERQVPDAPPPGGQTALPPTEPLPVTPASGGPGLIAGVPSFGTPAPPPTSAERQIEHDGETIFATGLAATHKVSSQQGTRGGGDLVLAAICSRQHPNPPDSRVCSRCGAPVDPNSPQLVNRPVLATVKASTGQVADLDSVILVGRSPSAGSEDNPVLMTVPSPSQDISRTHLRLAAFEWEIVVTDLHSTNGTMLLRSGEQPWRLHPGEPVSVGIGSVLDLGDGVTILIDQPK